MKDPRYQYEVAVSSQIILYNNHGQILIAKRPDNWEWMPGRWSLIGGKLYENEPFVDSIKRKTKQELGKALYPDGLFKLVQLLIKGRQAHLFVFVKKSDSKFNPSGEMEEYKWVNLKEIAQMSINDFSEYFYKDLLIEFLQSEEKVFLPMGFITSLEYFKISDEPKYKEWFAGGINKNYNPEEIKDFQKWKNKKS